MPNWVTTIINIEGEQKDLDAFKKFSINDNYYVREEKLEDRRILFDFGRYIPMPKEAGFFHSDTIDGRIVDTEGERK